MKRFLKVLIKIAVFSAAALAALMLLLSLCETGRSYLDDLMIESPNGEYTLIVKEWQTIGGGGAKIYCKKNGGSVKKLGEIITDDSVIPFHDGDYVLEWKENTVVIRYFSGRYGQTDDPDTWETVSYKLS